MINPETISNFNLTVPELEENILFWICAAGKNGKTSAKLLNKFMNMLPNKELSPFERLKRCSRDYIKNVMEFSGIGNRTAKSQGFKMLAHSDLDLKTCSTADLEKIHSIGPKTARGFIVHTRPNQRFAVIDTHILKFLRHQGYDAPKSTPSGQKYLQWEKVFLAICDDWDASPVELDLAVWNHYRIKENVNVPYMPNRA